FRRMPLNAPLKIGYAGGTGQSVRCTSKKDRRNSPGLRDRIGLGSRKSEPSPPNRLFSISKSLAFSVFLAGTRSANLSSLGYAPSPIRWLWRLQQRETQTNSARYLISVTL